jgi:hypothetical protein
MSIIIISRGTLSGGQRLAKCLAMNLGCQIISREVLTEAAQQYGVSEESLARGLAQPPSSWDRFRIDRQIYPQSGNINRQALATSTSFIEIRNLDSSFRREPQRKTGFTRRRKDRKEKQDRHDPILNPSLALLGVLCGLA